MLFGVLYSHVHKTGSHVTFRIHIAHGDSAFDTLFPSLYTCTPDISVPPSNCNN